METKKITKDIYANTDYGGANVTCVNTTEGTVLIDTPTFPSDIEDWKNFVLNVNTKGVQYIINTHIHFDHLIGNNRMGGKVVMHRLGGERLLKKGATLRETLSGMTNEWARDIDFILSEPLVSPEMTMEDQMTIHLGGYTFQLDHTGGHSADSILVYISEPRILLTGDNLTAGRHPYRGEASFSDWIQALERMKTYDIEYIIPGHGNICGREEIDRFIEYFNRQWDLAEDLVRKDLPEEEVVARVREEMFDFFEVEPEGMEGAGKMFDWGTRRLYREIKDSLGSL
jgi:cyclase